MGMLLPSGETRNYISVQKERSRLRDHSPEPPGGRTLWESLTNHTRLLGEEPWDFCPPGCRPYVGGGASDNNIFTFVNLS